MSSKELLLKELEDLNPLEILPIRNYLRELKGHAKKESVGKTEIDMRAVR